VDEREVQKRLLPPDVIGVPTRVDFAATLQIARRLHPQTERVFVVAGASPFDAAWAGEARRVFSAYEGELRFEYLTGLPMHDLLAHVASLPDRSIIFYLHIFQDGTGKAFVPAEALELLAARANAPIYGRVDTHVGRGLVGGHVFSFEAEGRSAARLGSRILAGERPESIAVPAANENADLFDWRQMQRWSIDERDLPPGSVVRFREPTFWGEYRWHVIGGIALCAVEALLILGLLVQRTMRRRADERFRQVVQAAPTGMFMIGRDGAIVMANPQAERIFGYDANELIGQPAEVLLSDGSRSGLRADRELFLAAPVALPLGLGPDLCGRRKDGTEVPVEIGLSPIRNGEGRFILASVVDLTERRRAEAESRASRRELELLAGQLIEAQEAERRRIARELHDDLNQELALLAVEIDLLGQCPPRSGPEVTKRMRELAGRVKELSATVHDLSHQLHPSKLEQLGLVAGVRGLCKELGQHHGLDLEFTHRDIRQAIPEATALCLYRITQEALQNVVKHGCTDRARVELTGAPGELRLQIRDEGVGFDPAAVPADGGLGLVSMRERLSLVGGQMVIDARPGSGTRIDARVPLPESTETARGASVSRPPEADLVTSGPMEPSP
jgi:PAS domain S-box-containing protein